MRLLSTLILGAALSVGLSAQEKFGPAPKYDPTSVTALVEKVHTDLNHSYGRYKFSGDDRERLNKAGKQLREFAKKWEGGKFDKDELDDAIGAIQKVLDNNKLGAEDRDALAGDIDQLRKMREAHNRGEIGRN